jgi:hypothetical protein
MIFMAARVDAMLSRVLVQHLNADTRRSWRDLPMTQRTLAHLLARFGVRTEEVYPAGNLAHGKGYKLVRFQDAFALHLPENRVSPTQRGGSITSNQHSERLRSQPARSLSS